MSISNKEIVKKSKEILDDLGYDVKVGHIYQLFSRLSGNKNWNVAKPANVAFVETVNQAEEVLDPTIDPSKDNPLYLIKLTQGDLNDLEIKKYYTIQAKNEKEAKTIMKEFIDAQSGEIEEKDVKYEQTKKLLEQEDNQDFTLNNWEVISNDSIPSITDIYQLPEDECKTIFRRLKFRKEMQELNPI